MLNGKLFNTELLSEIRDKFLYVDHGLNGTPRIFLDIAAGNFKLKTLPKLMELENSLPGQTICSIDSDSQRISKILEKGEEDWRIFLNAKDGVIWPELTASSMVPRLIFTVVQNIPGKNIVTTHIEHPCSGHSCQMAAEKYGKEVRLAMPHPDTGRVAPESISELVDEDTILVSFCHAANSSGVIHDAEKICKLVREKNPDVFIIIDGVQYAPIGSIDVDVLKPDAYVFAPYKVTGARGTGIAYLSERMSRLPHSTFYGLPETQWLLGSKNHANYAAWTDTMDYLCWLGSHFTDSAERRSQCVAAMNAINDHLLGLFELAYFGDAGYLGLSKIPGVNVRGAHDNTSRNCLILFDIDGWDSNDLVTEYAKRNIHVRARHFDAFSNLALTGLQLKKTVIRMSASHCTSPEEIKEFLRVTAELAASANPA